MSDLTQLELALEAPTAISLPGRVRVRVASPDPYAGLRGREYLHARGLQVRTRIGRQAPVDDPDCNCGPCLRERLLPAVQNIISARSA